MIDNSTIHLAIAVLGFASLYYNIFIDNKLTHRDR